MRLETAQPVQAVILQAVRAPAQPAPVEQPAPPPVAAFDPDARATAQARPPEPKPETVKQAEAKPADSLPERSLAEADPVTAARAEPAPPAASVPSFAADYLDNPPPAYPRVSRRLREEGEVELRVRVDAAGRPVAVELARSSGSERLDSAARAAVQRWRFEPARQGEQAVEAWVRVPIRFKLEA
ncbi:MAG: energy transducer TonB [Gammaproteobacteria bacterium]